MSKWTTEIRILDTSGRRPAERVTRFDDEDTETVLKLCQISGGQFIYQGYNAYCNRPCIDPIERKIWYTVELFEKVSE